MEDLEEEIEAAAAEITEMTGIDIEAARRQIRLMIASGRISAPNLIRGGSEAIQ